MSKKIRKFLVVVDDTSECHRAISYASRRAMQTKGKITLPIIILFQKANVEEKKNLEKIFSKEIRDEKDLESILSLIKKYDVIKDCYQKAQHYINLASNSLSIFKDSEEKIILENLTSFSLSRNF